MYPELAKLLPEFGDNWSMPMSAALMNAFNRVKAYDIPKLVKYAIENGMLEPSDGLGDVEDYEKAYCREFRLTNHGRILIGMKPWPVEKPKVVKKTLFD